jgi:hypothetical protein
LLALDFVTLAIVFYGLTIFLKKAIPFFGHFIAENYLNVFCYVYHQSASTLAHWFNPVDYYRLCNIS